MTPRVISAEAIRSAIGFEDLVAPTEEAFRRSSAGAAENGFLRIYPQADRASADVFVKTGAIAGAAVYVVKVAPWFAVNAAAGAPQGGFLAVFDSATGHTLAILDDRHHLSDMRTAAAGVIAAQLFAPRRVTNVVVVGAGAQAYWQVRALQFARPFETLRIWARRADQAEALAQRLAPHLPAAALTVEADLRTAVERADVVITATAAREPLIEGTWLRPGQHLTAVGADDPGKCELASDVLTRTRVFVDARDAAAANGDVARAIALGDYRIEAVTGEVGEVLLGRVAGRRSDDDITVAKLVGLGAQDLTAAAAVIEKMQLRAEP